MTLLTYTAIQEPSGEWTVLADMSDGHVFGRVEETGLLFGDKASADAWIQAEFDAMYAAAGATRWGRA